MVERGGLENRCARKRTEGSNPSLSAIIFSGSPTCQLKLAALGEGGLRLKTAKPFYPIPLSPPRYKGAVTLATPARLAQAK